MGLPFRVGHSKLRGLLCPISRSFVQLPYRSTINPTTSNVLPSVAEIPRWIFHGRPTEICNHRLFSAPAWAKPMKEEEPSGVRLNEQIKARFVRLVMDDGHSVVSIHEALSRARALKLDLVEVQRHADPPVCKIMDFHREKYKKEVTEKDRAKSKSESTLRKGEAKEVRFSLKTEQKDLSIKADSIKRLIERGYRVKCKVAGPELRMGRDESLNDFEARIAIHIEELQAALSRLSDMIADVAVIESGPHANVKEASILVRHEKFGPSKKGGAKKKGVATAVTQAPSETSDPDDNAVKSSTEMSVSNSSEAPQRVSVQTPSPAGRISGSTTLNKPVFENRYRTTEPQNQQYAVPMSNRGPYNSGPFSREFGSQKPVNVPENQFRQPEPQNRYRSAALMNDKAAGNSDSLRRDSLKFDQQHLNQRARSP